MVLGAIHGITLPNKLEVIYTCLQYFLAILSSHVYLLGIGGWVNFTILLESPTHSKMLRKFYVEVEQHIIIPYSC